MPDRYCGNILCVLPCFACPLRVQFQVGLPAGACVLLKPGKEFAEEFRQDLPIGPACAGPCL
ncbi:MAG TPA: hypothetical protein DCR20_08675 [Planctomycetaceae bacterium]|nr:hypothetical protein [Planctomycetaceae bacterium]